MWMFLQYLKDMWTGYVGEIQYAGGDTGTVDTVHIREQAQAQRNIIEDGSQDSGSLEDGPGQIPAVGREHLHEAGLMRPSLFDLLEWAGYLLAGVVVTALILILLGMFI